MSDQSLLQVKDLSVSIDNELPILHKINLDIKPGETHVLMGPNGAGKSTLGYTLMGNPHYQVTDGSILFEGEDFSNVLEVSDMVVDHGAFAELPVKMTNQDKITAVEFDLEMPSGFKLLSCSLTERKGDHGINYAQSENGSYHVTIFSLSSSVFTGSTGDLFTLHLLADSLGQHTIAVKNVELSTNDGDKRTPQDISASVTICDIPIGDVNGDGEVTITDAVSIVNHRLNRTPVRFISAAADLNADNEITITDAVRIVNMILSDQSNAKLRTESAISLPEPQ